MPKDASTVLVELNTLAWKLEVYAGLKDTENLEITRTLISKSLQGGGVELGRGLATAAEMRNVPGFISKERICGKTAEGGYEMTKSFPFWLEQRLGVSPEEVNKLFPERGDIDREGDKKAVRIEKASFQVVSATPVVAVAKSQTV